jgi:hypothetical protein
MIDLETLSLEPEAAVLSMGIAIFDESQVIDTIGWAIDLTKINGHIDMRTLAWWMEDGKDAARNFSFTGKYAPFTVAFELKAYLAKHNPQEFWANDPEFDLVVLKQWWKRHNANAIHGEQALGDYPLGGTGYKLSRSFRTIMSECERLGFDTKSFARPYIAHNPVDDAASQARVVIEARRLIGGGRYAIQS